MAQPTRKACPCCRRPGAAREAPARVEAPVLQPEHHPGCPVGPTATVGLDTGAALTPLPPACPSLMDHCPPDCPAGLLLDTPTTSPPARRLPLRC